MLLDIKQVYGGREKEESLIKEWEKEQKWKEKLWEKYDDDELELLELANYKVIEEV